MNNFSTMPLRFRVWDKKEQRFWSPDKVAIMNGELYFLENWVATDTTSYIFSILDDDRFIISQDTGLKDKNGKSIYTGDIIENPESTITTRLEAVGYSIESGYARIKPFYPEGDDDLVAPAHETKVIGNIWQNPELLEKK